MAWHARWDYLRRGWRLWAPLIPPVVYLSGLILHVTVNSVVGSLLNVAMYAFYGVLLAPFFWSVIRTFPSVFHLRVVRHILAGFALSMAATICLGITTAISGQSNGSAQVVLAAVAFVGFGLVFLAMFVGLLDASKSVIERYQSEHSRSSDV